jgi:3-hydroxyisobutyrate dehydrogenase
MIENKIISFFGFGIMAQGLVKNCLLKTDWKIRIYMRSPEKSKAILEEWKSLGYELDRLLISDSIPSTIQESSLLFLCLTDDSGIRDLIYNPDFKWSGERIPKVLCDLGTTSLAMTEELSSFAEDRGILFSDCPMTGSKLAAGNGEILYMFGGSQRAYSELQEFFTITGKKVIQCGEKIGSGQKIKQSLNMVQSGILQVYLEGFALAEKSGVSPEILLEVIENSAAKSGISGFKLPRVLEKNYETHFSLKNMYKDLMHSYDLALKVGANLPISFALNSVFSRAMHKNLGDRDFCSINEVNKEWNGLEN